MSRIAQGDGSSPSGSIKKRDRKRLAKYDRAIHFLDREILAMEYVRHPGLEHVVAKRNTIDEKRRSLRLLMKRTPVDLRGGSL